EEMMDIHCDTVTIATGNQPAGEKLRNVRVVSGAIGDGRRIHLSRPVNLTLHRREVCGDPLTLLPVWGSPTEHLDCTWSPDGCTALHTNSTHTTCSCDHLSSFALLMSPTAVESSPLTIVTYMGLTLSLPCVFLPILTFLLCCSIHTVSTSLRLQLCLCFFLADLLFLTTALCLLWVVCAVIAGPLHYLFLACFTWMFLEGLHLFLTIRNLTVMNYTSGFPALVVAISAAFNPDGYRTPQQLALAGMFYKESFMLFPQINLSLFLVILWILRDKLSPLMKMLLTIKAIAQLFIPGCTRSLGLLQVSPAVTVMAYLFTIVNRPQGAFIFLVHYLLNHQVKEEYRRWIKGYRTSSMKSQTSNLSMSAIPTTSTLMARGPLLCPSTSL
uniref:GPS domain-containing protein n=1 Tax=Chelonoidis abingdonii TaxID=106734 RepID=A0A8C0G9C4_CHEAB